MSAFFFLTRMHERYLLPTLAFMVFWVYRDRRLLPVFAYLSLFHWLNLYHNWWYPRWPELVTLLSPIINIQILILVALLSFIWLLWRYVEVKRSLLVAAFFYFFIAPFFFHPDIKIIYYLSQFFSHGVFNIYQYIAANPDKALLGPFVYPPLSYFVIGLIHPVVNFLAGPGFTPWLGMGNDAVDVAGIFRYLFLIKTPLILALLATGWALSKVSTRRNLLWIWFFNPVTIYVVGFMGQIDILPVMLTVFALLLAKPKPFLAAVLLGLGGALKTYPPFCHF